MRESTVKMRSGRIVAESEHEEVRLVAEAAAVHHSDGIALARTTESEQADGRLAVEAAPAAAVHHLETDTNAAATDSEHEEMRLVVGAAAALDLDEDASTTA